MFRTPVFRALSLTATAVVAGVASSHNILNPRRVFADIEVPSASTQPAAPATCPVAFMWRWTGAISLPFNHPPVAEVRASFDEEHYPKGVNNNFMQGTCTSCGETYGQGAGKGIFEDKESREIAKFLPGIITMLRSYGLKYGSYVADVGAGTGLVSAELSKEVGDCGEVYAQEISPGFQELLKRKVVSDKLSNVFVVGGSDKSAQLPDDAFDLILVCDVYHHFEYPRTMCK